MMELKPCPFCGGEASCYTFAPCDVSVICKNPDCMASAGGSSYVKEQEAADAWNRRTEVARMEYDREEIHENCTVHVLWNSETGQSSIGWWRNDKPPEVIK